MMVMFIHLAGMMMDRLDWVKSLMKNLRNKHKLIVIINWMI